MAFDPNAPFALTLRSRWGACLKSVWPLFLFNFNMLDGKSKAGESVSERLMAAFSEVLFKQHPAENCTAECSKCLFVVACRNMCVSVGVRRRGASQGRPFRSFRCLGDNEGNGKSGWVGGVKGPSRVSRGPR